MFKIHQRYLAATFIPPFVLATTFFVFFLMTFQLFRFTSFLVTKGFDGKALLLLLAHLAISFIPLALPLAVLLATIYTLNRLSSDSEIVAMRSFGASREKLFMPFFILGILIAGVLFSLNRQVIPFSKREVRNTYMKLASRAVLKQVRPEEFFTQIPGITLYAGEVGSEGKEMKNLFLFMEDKKTKEEKIIFAREGTLITNAGAGLVGLNIELKKGSIIRKEGNNLEKISFDKYTFPPFKRNPGFDIVNKASMKSNKDLKKEIVRLTQDFEQLDIKKKVNSKRKDLFRNLLEYWTRFNTPLVVLACVLLGFSVGIKTGRGKEKNSALLAMMVLVPYYGLFFFGLSMAKTGDLYPSVAVFVPTVIFFMAAFWFYRKVDWIN